MFEILSQTESLFKGEKHQITRFSGVIRTLFESHSLRFARQQKSREVEEAIDYRSFLNVIRLGIRLSFS
jgi:hypothetical protein